MAISKMSKLSILVLKSEVEAILQSVQQLQSVQVRDVADIYHEEELSELKSSQTLVTHVDLFNDVSVSDQDAIQYLTKRELQLELALKQYARFLPKKSVIQSLKEGKRSVTFDTMQQSGESFDEVAYVQYIQQAVKQLDTIDDSIESAKLEINTLEPWKSLDIVPSNFKGYRYIHGYIGTVPNTVEDAAIKWLRSHDEIVVKDVFMSDQEYGVIIFLKDVNNKDVLETLYQHEFKTFDYYHNIVPQERIDVLKENIVALKAERDTLVKELATKQSAYDALLVQYEYVASLKQRELAKLKSLASQHLVMISGWIESDRVAAFTNLLTSQFAHHVIVTSEEIDIEAEDEASIKSIPVKLNNNALVKPFELVTKMYALPRYDEVDPTPFLMPFYLVFFGMMVADIGYGLIMMIGTFLAIKCFNLDEGTSNFLKFFHILGWATVIWGFIYGSFMGVEMPFKLLDTTNDVTTILIISIVFGVIQILLGLLLSTHQHIKKKDYIEAYKSGMSWFLVIVGVALLVVGMFIPGFELLATVGKWVAIINAIGIVVAAIVKSKSLAGLGSGLYDLYGASSYVGDLVSYTRLMALGLSGGSIAAAFNMIIDFFPPVGKFTIGILLFIVLHALNIFLSLLGAYVHGARLMFVEFFGKFYSGGGKAFEPLRPLDKYVKINTNDKLEEKA